MDIPLLTFFSSNTFLISFGFCAALSFVLAVLINLVRIAYSSCILSEATFEKVKQLKPSVRNHLLWLLNRPLATHFSLNFFQTLFLILTFLFAVLASSNMGMEIWIVCSIMGAVGLLLILVCMLTTSLALSHSVAVLKSTTRLTGMFVRIATFVFRLKKEESVDDEGDTFSVEGLEQALEMQKTEDEKAILDSVLHFGEETVAEIMIPRVDVIDLSYEASLDDVMKCVIENNYSRIPVCDRTQDKIKGILYVKDLLPYASSGKDFEWQKLIRPAFFVPESKMIDDLLREFQKSKVHIAVVVDEYGVPSGIVTMEDILEEIVGEINDEYDEEEKQFVKLDDNHYIFEGKTPLDEFFEITGISEETFKDDVGEAETLAGFVLELLDEMPTKHQKASCRNLTFEVLALDKQRISKIKLTIADAENKENMPD